MQKIKVSKQIKFLNFIYKQVKQDYSFISILKTFSLFDSILSFFSLVFISMAVYMSKAGLIYYFVPLLIGMAIYGILLFACKNRLYKVKLSDGEKDQFAGIVYGLSYDLINKTCSKRNDLGLSELQLEETIKFVEKNPFKEPILFEIPNYMKSLYGLFITTTVLLISVYRAVLDSIEQTPVNNEVTQASSEPEKMLLVFILILSVFAITSYFFKSIQPLSINERVIRVLSLIRLSICKK